MRYWWVNQNQTFKHEVEGGYMWSPKTKANGALNHYYETMRMVARGDFIFSFKDRKIMAVGIARRAARTCPKPLEFGSAGAYWNEVGWRVEVTYRKLPHPIEPRAHMRVLGPLLPKKHAPLRLDGDGNQIYLTEVPKDLGQALIDLIGVEAIAFLAERATIVAPPERGPGDDAEDLPLIREWEQHLIKEVEQDPTLIVTEKEQVIKSRRGQGLFRNRVADYEKACRVTRVDDFDHLIASHIKPWKVANNNERIDGANGLMLTPTIDHLFDEGYISFRDNGNLLVSPVTPRPTLIKMGIPKSDDYNVGSFSQEQRHYLNYHRDMIFLQARA
ncbi:MAG: hypothetical protein MOGMAGMI_00108 [Candidatus Omnitrophica bacterium]|nr:hypothetical protein [Candidatus Omnitrophota bacterium]